MAEWSNALVLKTSVSKGTVSSNLTPSASMDFLIKGLILGFSIAAPVGPIGILCIRRTLADGRLHGFVSGLGAATADAIYGAIAAFGLTIISGFLLTVGLPIRVTGTLFIVYLAFRIFFSNPREDRSRNTDNTSFLLSYSSTVLLTLTNPSTIISFLAVFAGFGLGLSGTSYFDATTIVFGVFLGSALWWLILSYSVGAVRHMFSDAVMTWVNRASGLLMGCLAVYSFLTIIY